MKLRFKLFPIFLSTTIILLSVLQCSITVYASSSGIHTDKDKAILNKFFEDGKYYATYWITQLGAIFGDYSFSKVMENKAAWEDYWNGENIIVDADSRTVTFSEDLMTAFKQALLEVAEEENGFKIYPTIDYMSLSPSMFASNYTYGTFCNLVRQYGCIDVNTRFLDGDTLYVSRPFHDITSDSVSLVAGTKYSDYMVSASFYGTNIWQLFYAPVKIFRTVSYDADYIAHYTSYKSWNEGTDFTDGPYSECTSGILSLRASYPTGSLCGWTLFSDDGRKLRVFNSLNALKNYTTGNRSVYFGSGFYDTPGEIKVSFDDLEKYIDGKYDDFFKDLKDLIGDNEDNLTEEDLEKLVDKILDKMDESGGNNKPGDSTGDNSSILDGISGIFESMTSTISGYLDAILMYLESILTDLDYIVLEMQDMTEEEVSTKSDSVISELSDAFSEIGDVMSKKFPFSIPWDIKSLYVTLSGGKEPGIQSLSDDIGISDLYNDSSPPPATGGKLIDVVFYPSPADDGIMTLVADEDLADNTPFTPSGDASFTDSGAPVFKIPFVIRSAGVNAAILLDMSYFDVVSSFSRTMFLLIFLYQLFLLSMRVFEFVKSFMG